ncbi:MAG: sugar ABC transporter ATP-binding protein [Alphaproteobacteria bacterium]
MTGQPSDTLALRATGVSKTFGGVRALIDVDVDIREGEVHCLAGENGSGKSTLIKIISGVYAPEPGAEIVIGGNRVERVTPALARHLGIQVIWQDLALFPHLSVAENIAFEGNLGARPHWVRRTAFREVARATLDRIGFAVDLDQTVGELSIARRQLVAICRALVADARIVFMDEPTASLTRAETEALFGVVRTLSADGIAVVFVSHRLAEVMAIAERVTVLRDGRRVGCFASAEISQQALATHMTGLTFDDRVRAEDRGVSPVVLETKKLGRSGEFEDVSIQVRAGEVLGITGLLGAGRTELASVLFGLTRPDRGEILLDGEPLRLSSNRDAIAKGVAYVSEDRLTLGLIEDQSIADNTVIAVIRRLAGRLGLIDRARKDGLVRDWIRRLAVRIGEPSDPVKTLSGGNQQRIVLSKWLATEPRILILDAPTVGVDVGARAGIFEIVRSLAAEGKAIILISDEIPEVYFNADRILHMRGGRMIGAYDPRAASIDEIENAVHG